MKLKYISILFIAAGLLVSCNKFLDVKPKGYTIPEFFEDYQKLMNSMSLLRTGTSYPVYFTDDIQSGEDNDVTKGARYQSLDQVKRNAYEFRPAAIFLPGEGDPFWENAYGRIYTYNTIINNTLATPDGTDATKKALVAQAKVARAFEYLMLVNGYAKAYDVQTAATDLGVPLVLSEDISKPYTRVSIQKIYDQVLSDLISALPDLNTIEKNKFVATRSVGYAFLAKVYLYMNNYSEALKNATEALKQDSGLIDYKLYTTKKGVTFGRVCLKTNLNEPFPNAATLTNKENIWVRLSSGNMGSMDAQAYVSKDLLNIFEKDLPQQGTDQRLALFACKDESTFSTKSQLFPGRTLWAPYFEQNTGLSTPEVYLIAAECEARIGSVDHAMQLINKLRDNRIEGNQPLTASDKNDALIKVINERRREFCFKTCIRFFDLKRLNREPNLATTITHTHNQSSFTLAPNDPKYILPVPPKVLDLNPGIPQYAR